VKTFTFDVGAHGTSSAALYPAKEPLGATLVLAHGAGAPRTHPFMTTLATALAGAGLDVVTFNFLYAESGKKMPDRPELLETCFASAISAVRARRGLPTERLFVGGKSMGGRFAARIAAGGARPPVAGLVILGYPLHPPGKPQVRREEIFDVSIPRLVVQGTRDPFGTPAELTRRLGRANVVAVDDGDHSLTLPKRCGPQAQAEVFARVATAVAQFARRVAADG